MSFASCTGQPSPRPSRGSPAASGWNTEAPLESLLVEMKVVGEDGNDLPPGGIGEIYVLADHGRNSTYEYTLVGKRGGLATLIGRASETRATLTRMDTCTYLIDGRTK